MGLLNHLFGGRKGAAEELLSDENRRLALWRQHLANFAQRESLARPFLLKNSDVVTRDFAAVLNFLDQVERLISAEVIEVEGEERLEAEIEQDLARLKNSVDVDSIYRALAGPSIARGQSRRALILELFQEIHKVLTVELHMIKLIRKKPANAQQLLLRLAQLIFYEEERLYKLFDEESFHEKSVHADIVRIAHAVLLEQKVEEAAETAETIFARKMFQQMSSSGNYRQLGERIFEELFRLAVNQLPETADIVDVEGRVEEFLKDDNVLHAIIKRLRPRFDIARIKATGDAFQNAFKEGHFEEIFLQVAEDINDYRD